MITISPTFSSTYPGACAGFLAMRNVVNPEHDDALDRRKEALEADLRLQFAGKDRSVLATLPSIQAYTAYYKRFNKTYHVLLQLESVALKGRTIPRVAALVEAMFMAELKNQLLTAGHDLDVLQTPVTVGVASGSERYIMLNSKEQTLAAGDMFMSDGQGVVSAVIHGPDQRTCIRPTTTSVLFAIYAPAGIGETAVQRHLEDIRDNVHLIAPAAKIEMLRVYAAQT
jgi:DNA/RNA-binding domain of Phe-tRNA-synthetase-like protein